MPQDIEDYAVIDDLHTAALVGKTGLDWDCITRFDSAAQGCQLSPPATSVAAS
ncbi:hypothetical protein ACFT4A_34450 [Streptomyces sp. NPDC057099]|uniref:hypothetical protein n=1 Tax=Streptomyces sp. NPDC057099 TaxID=3346019 RepID=UPI0036341E0F